MGLFPWAASWCLLAPPTSCPVWSGQHLGPQREHMLQDLLADLRKPMGGKGVGLYAWGGAGEQARRTERALHEVTCGHFPEN